MSLARFTLFPFRHTLRPALLTGRFYATGPSTTTKQPGSPPTTQGHATQKGHSLNIQEDSANKGQAESSSASGGGGNQPFDAARMSGSGGEKKSGEGKGPFKDQVGGQEGGATKMGGTEDTAGGSTGDMIKKAVGLGKGERHQSVGSPQKGGQREYHTSARLGATQPEGSRKPKESDLAGDQNEHLSHTSNPDPNQSSGKGNASADPHLPSQSGKTGSQSQSSGQVTGNSAQSGKASGQVKGFASFHTSARVAVESKGGYVGSHEGEGAKEGHDVPPEALPPNLESNYNRAETHPPKPNMTPSSEAEYSSTAQDPPNQALREAVKGGGMDPRNDQPSGEVGEQGLGEAWKNRKA